MPYDSDWHQNFFFSLSSSGGGGGRGIGADRCCHLKVHGDSASILLSSRGRGGDRYRQDIPLDTSTHSTLFAELWRKGQGKLKCSQLVNWTLEAHFVEDDFRIILQVFVFTTGGRKNRF